MTSIFHFLRLLRKERAIRQRQEFGKLSSVARKTSLMGEVMARVVKDLFQSGGADLLTKGSSVNAHLKGRLTEQCHEDAGE